MLMQSVNTRWNSVYDMLNRFICLSDIVAKILPSNYRNNKHLPDMVTASQLNVLKDLVSLLAPFKQFTEEISGENYVTASLVIPLTCLLLKDIEQQKLETDHGMSRQENLIGNINSRLIPLEKNKYLAKATIFDPRFKKAHFQSALAYADALNDISKQLNARRKEKPQNPSDPEEIIITNNEKSLWDRHEKIFVQGGMQSDTTFGTFPIELKQYLDEKNIPRTSSPLKYWKSKYLFTPELSNMSLKYLVVMASSVSSERKLRQ